LPKAIDAAGFVGIAAQPKNPADEKSGVADLNVMRTFDTCYTLTAGRFQFFEVFM